jgi:hypothetical protein
MHLTPLRFRILETFRKERSSILYESVILHRTEIELKALMAIMNKLIVDGLMTVRYIRRRGDTFERQYTATPLGWKLANQTKTHTRDQINAQFPVSR